MKMTLNYLGQSPLFHERNTTLDWHGSDDKRRFLANSKDPTRRALLESLGWFEREISYKINEYGFRCDDFRGEGAMFLGCSHTFGTGIEVENSWPYLVAKELGLKCWNLGIPGGSRDTAFRIASYWIPILKPKYVFVYWPDIHRAEMITTEGQRQWIVWHTGADDFMAKYYTYYFAHEENCILNGEKNRRGIAHICAENNVRLIDDFCDNKMIPGADPDDMARDLMHFGISWNQIMAKNMLDSI